MDMSGRFNLEFGRAGFRDFSIYGKGRAISRILREKLAQNV